MTADTFMLGTLAGGPLYMTALSTLLWNKGIPVDPDHSFAPFSKVWDLGDGGQRGAGFPTCTWHWTSLSASQLEALRVYCPNQSADVYIRVPTSETDPLYGLVWHTYQAKMLWMSGERGKQPGNRVLDVEIRFRMLIEVE